MNTVRIFLIVTFVIAVTAACGSGLSLCNGQCYSQSGNSCPTDQVTGSQVLCPLNFLACNGACYSASQYNCANGGLQAGAAPSKAANTANRASSSTFSSSSTSSTSSTKAVPSTSSTSSTSSTQAAASTSSQAAAASTSSQAAAVTSTQTCITTGCGVGTCNCNGACFAPGQYNCPVDPVTGKTMLCQGSLSACNGNCFDATKYSCRNGALVQGGQAAAATSSSQAAAASPASTSSTSSQTPVATSSVNPVVNPTPAPNQFPTQVADLRIINSCKSTLWFEARYGGQGAPIPGASATATRALPGGYVDYTIPATGLGGTRFWAKYGCDVNGKNCLVGDQMQYWPNPPGGCPANGCTPPVDSLFEATWGCRPGASCNAQNPTTWFDTSQVDGWTIPYKLTPNGDTSGCDCIGTQCGFSGVDASHLDLARCPRTEDLSGGVQTTANVNGKTINLSSVDLRIINNGSVLGCLSPCKRLNWGAPYGLGQEESSGSTLWMCCPTPTPDNCNPSNGCVSPQQCRSGPIENTQFVAAVHNMAPGIYSYSYDDGVGLHACPAGVVTYTMEFCPAGSAPYPAQA